MREIDNLVIGGGIFGCHSAIMLSKTGKTLILESRSDIMNATTRWNHGRVHTGLHYLNDYDTAKQANDAYTRFIVDNQLAINNRFKHIYAIDKNESRSGSEIFEKLANQFKIDYSKINIDILNYGNLESSYILEEPTYDIFALKNIYKSRLENKKVEISTNSAIVDAEMVDGRYCLTVSKLGGSIEKIIVNKNIFVATYDQINPVLSMLGLPAQNITYVLGKQAYANIPKLLNLGLMVVDGPFLSVSPFGFSGLHALNASKYNNFLYSDKIEDVHAFQEPRDEDLYFNMSNEINKYLNIDSFYVHSTKRYIRTLFDHKLNPESRQTSIRMVSENPKVYAVLSGKVSNIYEIDSIRLE